MIFNKFIAVRKVEMLTVGVTALRRMLHNGEREDCTITNDNSERIDWVKRPNRGEVVKSQTAEATKSVELCSLFKWWT
ncbi:MAG: hypothetical protein ACTS6H_02325 [Candidatus Hodgkinia cicadicola]